MDSSGKIADLLVDFQSRLNTIPGLGAISVSGVVTTLIIVPLVSSFAWMTVSWAFSPLRGFPGPFLAGYTNLWRLYIARRGDYHVVMQKLHEKYGPVLRIGPNLLDLDYPELAKVIYTTDGKWLKTEFYQNNSTIINGKITYHMFSTTDQVEHAQMKRPIVKHYSISAVLGLEPHMDSVITDFCKHLDNRFVNHAKGPKEFDLGEWIAFYAWDLIGSATMSRRFGYMDAGHDHDNTIAIADKALDYFSTVAQMPWLDFVFDKNPVCRIGPPNLSNITGIALNSLITRQQGQDKNYNPKVPDYLEQFLESKNTHPDLVHDGIVMGYMLVNLIAGADTTAITLRSIFYYCLKNPQIYQCLEAAVRGANLDRDQPAPYNVARQIPYLEAVVCEALRFHPAVAMTMERYVPETGLQLPNGQRVPPGTAVGLNAYITGRNKAVYGEDANEFRPERWLPAKGESDEDFRTRLNAMKAADVSFGGGSRICLGRHLALMEVYKIVATLLNRYEIALANPEKEWEVQNSWFLRQKGLIVKMKTRQ